MVNREKVRQFGSVVLIHHSKMICPKHRMRLAVLAAGTALWAGMSLGMAEPRVFLTEFMAASQRGVNDRNQHLSDWIEIYNASPETVDLGGWFLTDDRRNLAKWRFPSTNLVGNGYLLVFASQKDRQVPGRELHTNFKLDAAGEYLALIEPDGRTIASQFSPAFPRQLANTSYGLAMGDFSDSPLPSLAEKRVLVPTGDLGTAWTGVDFEDSAWQAGSNGIGYDQSTNYTEIIGIDLRSTLFRRNSSVYVRAPFQLADPQLGNLKLRLRYDDGFIAYLNGREVARRNAPLEPRWNSTATAVHGLARAEALSEEFEAESPQYLLSASDPDAPSRLRLSPRGQAGGYLRLVSGHRRDQVNSLTFNDSPKGRFETIVADFDFRFKSTGESPSELTFLLLPTALYGKTGPGLDPSKLRQNREPSFPKTLAVRLQLYPNQQQNTVSVFWNGSRKGHVAFSAREAAIGPRSFHHAQLRLQQTANGALLSFALKAGTQARESKPYTPFTSLFLAGLAAEETRVQLAGHIANEDGTIDLDNVQVQFIPASALSVEDFDLTRFVPALRAGKNVLAIHGFNAATDDPSFLLFPELMASRISVQTNTPLYFANPTPRAPNQEGFPSISSPPRFSKAGGVYVGAVSLELSAPSGSGAIRYTVDGSEPNPSSPLYQGPIEISRTTLVRARTFESGLHPSPAAAETYTLADQDLAAFSSNLPLVILNPFGQYIRSRGKIPASARFIEPANGRSKLTGPAEFDGRIDIKRRGHSTLRLPKASYSFELREEGGAKEKVSLLGFPKDSDWVLYAPYSDKTLIRDLLAYELSNQMGHYAPRTRLVEAFVNSSRGRLSRDDYAGVYVLIEKIKRGKKRVNIKELGPGDNAEPEISGGYLFKRDHWEDEGGGFSTGRGNHFFYIEPNDREITPQQKAWLSGYVNEFERTLYGPAFADPQHGYAAYLDVESFLDQHWLIEMSKNIDGFRYSTFLQKDRGGKLKLEPIWDWNLSFGNADYYDGWKPEKWYTPRLRESEISWFRRLVQDPDFSQKHIDRWAQLRAGVFAPERILARIDELASLLEEAQARNFQRWRILGQRVTPNYYSGDTYKEEVTWMKNWIQKRIAWIDGQFLQAPVSRRKAGRQNSGSTLSLHAPAGEIYYTEDGTDTRLPGGGVSPKARPYSAPLSLEKGTKIFARVHQANNWSSPTLYYEGDKTRVGQ